MSGEHESLDYVRIRRLASLRRGQHRSALFMLGFACLCIVMACALVGKAIVQFRIQNYLVGFGLVIGVAPLLWLAQIAWRRRNRILREIYFTHHGFPLDPPDFSTLQDGSQLAKSLEDMVDQ